MVWMTELHTKAALGGSWPEKTPQVTRWTAAAIAAAATTNPIQTHMRRQLLRCTCVVGPKPADPMCPTTSELVQLDPATNKPTTEPCNHWVTLAEIRSKLQFKNGPQDKRTVLQVCCGSHKPRSAEGRSMIIAKLEDLRVFAARHADDKGYFANPNTEKLKETDLPIQLVVEESYTTKDGKSAKYGVCGVCWEEPPDPDQFRDPPEGQGEAGSSSAPAAQ